MPSVKIRTLYNNVKHLAKDYSEVEVKVPWGKIAGKLWGAENRQPLLALHGWQDNSGSFDALAPLLKDTPILAIDLPGHGLSSWLPPGQPYLEMVYVLLIQRLKIYYGWEKVKILAHSLSAETSFWYASLFPNDVEFVIALDSLKFPSIDVAKYSKLFGKGVTKFYELEKSLNAPRKYTEEELIKKWMTATRDSVDENACKTLMLRGTSQVEDGKYILNRDPRLRIVPIHTVLTHDHLQKLAELISCPYLVIKATGSTYFEDKKYFYDILDVMKKNNEHVQYERVAGTHHVHMRDPVTIANLVNPFLEKYNG